MADQMQTNLSKNGEEYTDNVKNMWGNFSVMTQNFRQMLNQNRTMDQATYLNFKLWIASMEEQLTRALNEWQQTEHENDDMRKQNTKKGGEAGSGDDTGIHFSNPYAIEH